jgi:hypothetical protein
MRPGAWKVLVCLCFEVFQAVIAGFEHCVPGEHFESEPAE